MLLKDKEIDIENEQTAVCYQENNVVIYNLGCYVAKADTLKLFYLLKDIIKTPTVIFVCCNVTLATTTTARLKIHELKELYPNYKVIITGCMNELVEDKYRNLGKIIYKNDMWEVKNYE